MCQNLTCDEPGTIDANDFEYFTLLRIMDEDMSVEQAQAGEGQDENCQVNPGFSFTNHNLRQPFFPQLKLGVKLNLCAPEDHKSRKKCSVGFGLREKVSWLL